MKKEKLKFNRSALLLVDMQNVYLSGSEFETDDWEKIVANVKKLIECCRNEKIPIVFIRMWYRPDGSDALPNFPRDIKGRPSYAVAGTKEAGILDALKPEKGEIIIHKQRMSAFFQTNIELTLQGLGVKHLMVTGVSTDVYVLATIHDAYFRGYEITIVKDACGSETKAAHMTSILNMANWVYGCSIFHANELIKAIKRKPFHAWFWERPGQYKYTVDTIIDMYEQI